MTRLVVVGTELARLERASGALERVVLDWVGGLAAIDPTIEVLVVDATGPDGPPDGAVAALHPDVVVLNNRPLWSEHLSCRVVHLLHNYPDAWGAGSDDDARVAAALGGGHLGAVSDALAREVEHRYRPPRPVARLAVGVEREFLEESWRGAGGPLLFPGRLLEKKGVRFFLELAEVLGAAGHRCVCFRHLAPFSSPTPEQEGLLAAIAAAERVEMVPPPPSRAAMAAWYATAGVVLSPSLHPEGLGLVALEAQAVGAPLVTSGRGGLAEATFPPNEVVESFEVDRWVAAVERAIRRPPDRRPGLAVRERHGPEVARRSFAALFAQATKDRRG